MNSNFILISAKGFKKSEELEKLLVKNNIISENTKMIELPSQDLAIEYYNDIWIPEGFPVEQAMELAVVVNEDIEDNGQLVYGWYEGRVGHGWELWSDESSFQYPVYDICEEGDR